MQALQAPLPFSYAPLQAAHCKHQHLRHATGKTWDLTKPSSCPVDLPTSLSTVRMIHDDTCISCTLAWHFTGRKKNIYKLQIGSDLYIPIFLQSMAFCRTQKYATYIMCCTNLAAWPRSSTWPREETKNFSADLPRTTWEKNEKTHVRIKIIKQA